MALSQEQLNFRIARNFYIVRICVKSTITEAAEKAGVSYSALHRFETRRFKRLPVKVMEKLMLYYCITETKNLLENDFILDSIALRNFKAKLPKGMEMPKHHEEYKDLPNWENWK